MREPGAVCQSREDRVGVVHAPNQRFRRFITMVFSDGLVPFSIGSRRTGRNIRIEGPFRAVQ
jgi:hypothetical protein